MDFDEALLKLKTLPPSFVEDDILFRFVIAPAHPVNLHAFFRVAHSVKSDEETVKQFSEDGKFQVVAYATIGNNYTFRYLK